MNRTYQTNKASFALPRKKFRTIIDRDVWLWARVFRQKEESNMSGEITVPCNMAELRQTLFDLELKALWTLTFGHKEESNHENGTI